MNDFRRLVKQNIVDLITNIIESDAFNRRYPGALCGACISGSPTPSLPQREGVSPFGGDEGGLSINRSARGIKQ